ncbi:hypothetical protein HK098_003560 [Nowakowskiella sp. JEL0407]|nr:hypothetical protein HK098_003560 [Nowakowskiella sp. JEL0407]
MAIKELVENAISENKVMVRSLCYLGNNSSLKSLGAADVRKIVLPLLPKVQVCSKLIDIFKGFVLTVISPNRELFQSLGQPYSTFELDLRDDGADIQAYLLEKTGQKTVPNIFINGQHIGGNDTIQAKHVSGELAKLLA